jgi:hypothetical protein
MSPYMKAIRFVFKGLLTLVCRFFDDTAAYGMWHGNVLMPGRVKEARQDKIYHV